MRFLFAVIGDYRVRVSYHSCGGPTFLPEIGHTTNNRNPVPFGLGASSFGLAWPGNDTTRATFRSVFV